MKFLSSLVTLFLLTFSTLAQIDGENVFGSDQVIEVHLTYSQADFWSDLVDEYEGEQNYIQANVTFIDNQGETNIDSVGVRLKGNSSYSHPGEKKSFKIDINRFSADDGQNYDGLKKINFSNGFKDPTFIREKLFFDLCQELGVHAPRANYAVVYMNEEYWGFYTLVEQVDDQFLDWAIEDDDGNLFKAGDNFGFGEANTPADLVYYGDDQAEYEERYELKTNEEVNDWSDLIEFIEFVNNSNDADFESDWSTKLNTEDFIKSMALDNLFSNLDAYIGSARNYYVYHNMTLDRWEWIKWDANEVFGTYGGMGLDLESLSPDYFDDERPLVERMFEIDGIYQEYLDVMCELNTTVFNNDYLDPIIDDYKALIEDYVEADYNKQYSFSNFEDNIEQDISTGGMGGGNVFGLKSFVEAKHDYIMSLLSCSVGIQDDIREEDILLFPNPTRDLLNIAGIDQAEQVQITNVLGQVVYEANRLEKEISLRHLKRGIYFYDVQLEGGKRIRKNFVKN